MEMFGMERKELIPEVEQIVGAATFLEIATKADMTLFIKMALSNSYHEGYLARRRL